MEFIDPTTGGPAMSSISTFLQRLPEGSGRALPDHRGLHFHLPRGRRPGRRRLRRNRNTIEFRPKDVFCVPCWYPFRLEADEDTYLFQGTDKVVQTKLGLWREKRGNA